MTLGQFICRWQHRQYDILKNLTKEDLYEVCKIVKRYGDPIQTKNILKLIESMI